MKRDWDVEPKQIRFLYAGKDDNYTEPSSTVAEINGTRF